MNSRRILMLLIGAATLALALLTTLALRYAWTGEPASAHAPSVASVQAGDAKAELAVTSSSTDAVAKDGESEASDDCGSVAAAPAASHGCCQVSGSSTHTTVAARHRATESTKTDCSESESPAIQRGCSLGTEADVAGGWHAKPAVVATAKPAAAGGGRVADPFVGTGSVSARTFKLLPYDPTTW